MNKTLLIILFTALCSSPAFSQIFFFDNFNNGCTSNCLAETYTGPGGAWTVSTIGVNSPTPNKWFISCAENGMPVGSCGSGCIGGGDATLHIASTIDQTFATMICPTGDCGAAYYAGLPPLDDATTNQRVESPLIDCALALCAPKLSFKYIFFGDPPFDYFMVEYFDGSSWTIIDNPAQTTVCGSGQGQWTNYSLILPASAIGNPTIKVGFRWINNNDGNGTDPSVAIDSVMVSTPTPPDPQFSVTNNPLCEGATTTVVNDNIEPGVTYSWNYGYNTFTGATPPAFDATLAGGAGTYQITLTASNACGSVSTSTFVTVQPCSVFTADFNLDQDSICVNGCISISNQSNYPAGPITFAWSFPGGLPTSSNLETPPTICYNTPGSYTITLILSDGLGSIDTATATVTVTTCNTPPIAAFNPGVTGAICSGDCLNITNTSTYLTGATFAWTFPGGTPASSSAIMPPQVCFNTVGSVIIKLVVTNPNGQKDSTTYNLTVNNCNNPPTADFALSDTSICSGQTISFTNNSIAATNAIYTWTFPGGTPNSFNGASPPAIHFNTAGTFTVQLIVTDNGGADTAAYQVTIQNCPVPVALFSASSLNICKGDSVVFTDQSQNATTWSWTFAGGLPASFNAQTPPAVVYTTPGVYTATLLVTDGAGLDSTYSLTINVSNCGAPIPAFTASHVTICEGDCIQFFDQSTDNPQGWYWSFPGGVPSFSTQQNPPYICYNNPGVYPVSLRVFNSVGIDSLTIQAYIVVNSVTQVNTTFDSITIILGESVTLGASGGVFYKWYPNFYLDNDSIAHPIATPNDTILYNVVMTDMNGCTSAANVLVNVRPPNQVFVPNVFTPNNDAVNDFIKLYTTGVIEKSEFYIFDRWGNRVFYSDNVNDRWDGTYKGKNCNSGVYVYYYRVAFSDGRVMKGKGDITLIR